MSAAPQTFADRILAQISAAEGTSRHAELVDQLGQQFKAMADTMQSLQERTVETTGPAWDTLQRDLALINVDVRFGDEEMGNYQVVQDGMSNIAKSLDEAVDSLKRAAVNTEFSSTTPAAERIKETSGGLLPWTRKGR